MKGEMIRKGGQDEQHKKKHVIEFAPFTLAKGVDESTLIAASDALQEEFLSQQKGFIKRDLVRTADGKWVDVAYWDSMENAEQAMQNASNSPIALRYFELMVHADHNDPSTEVMLLSVIRSYS